MIFKELMGSSINLSTDSQIILRNGEQPVISKKVFYYADEEVKKKIMTPKNYL